MNADPQLQTGQIFARYQIVRIIGEGGMGTVYEAFHPALKKRFAIKTLLASIAQTPEFRARFLREAEVAARSGAKRAHLRNGLVVQVLRALREYGGIAPQTLAGRFARIAGRGDRHPARQRRLATFAALSAPCTVEKGRVPNGSATLIAEDEIHHARLPVYWCHQPKGRRYHEAPHLPHGCTLCIVSEPCLWKRVRVARR